MQVSSVSNDLAFQGSERRRKLPKRRNVDALINLDDNSAQAIAYLKTANQFDRKKYNRTIKGLLLAAPVAAGVAGALIRPSVALKNIKGPAARAFFGLDSFLGMSVLLGVGAAIGKGASKLREKSEDYRDFDNNNKVLSFILTAGAVVGALVGLRKGSSALLNKVKPETFDKFYNKLVKKADKFNNNKYVKSIAKHINKLGSKTHESIKDFGETVLSWSPLALIGGAWLYSHNTNKAMDKEFHRNYMTIKDKQLKTAQHRVRELAVQNDLLLLNENNLEELGEFESAKRKGRIIQRRQAMEA